ncbi:hypothetical protein [Prevotella communis]|uniref:hypothetical protein n=1 Tax=Prevotella communis TaxID=2913614 RepID=UPI0024E0B884|nr:hypothetical protein [Prevotella communis]
MSKISIKREQSQAGLSFAEREKFRPQVKNKLLLLLALLLTAATGAWAQDYYAPSTDEVIILNEVYNASNSGYSSHSAIAWGGSASTSNKKAGDPNNGGVSTSSTVSCYSVKGTGQGKNITLSITGVSKVIVYHERNSSRYIELRDGSKTGNIIGSGQKNTWYTEVALTATNEYSIFLHGTSGSDDADFNVYAIKLIAAADPAPAAPADPAPAAAAGYTVSLKDGVKDADKWTVKVGDGQAQALPIGGLKGNGSETVTLQYNGRLKVKGVKATSEAAPAAGKTVDLSTLTADYEAQDGDVLTGETTSCKVTIAAGATVTLDGVNITKYGYCIKCLGDATIILKDGSKNTLTGTSTDYPALSIGDANTTLTIQGSTGVLNVTSGNYCAGIGGGYSNTNNTCGNIRIEGGVITAQGGNGGSGIGSDCGEATCGDIIITGGTITAKGGGYAAGIGTGNGRIAQVVCGNITIANTVTKVTATAGEEAPYSIGKGDGDDATCGTVTIGGTKYWENKAAVNGGDTYLAQSPLIYDPAAPAAAEGHALSASAVGEIVGSDGKAYAAADKDNLPTGVTAVAMVAYKSATAGSSLAIALADEGKLNWATAKSTCEGKTAIGGNSWKLPSQDDWKQMFSANGGNEGSYSGLNSAITTAGGTVLPENGDYWSSTPNGESYTWDVFLSGGATYWYGDTYVDDDLRVRACFAF